MHFFDVSVILWLNQFARQSYAFDATVVLVSDSELFKGVVLMASFWWEWFLMVMVRRRGGRYCL